MLNEVSEASELLEMLNLEDDQYLEALQLMGMHQYIKAHKEQLVQLDDDRVLVQWLDTQTTVTLPKNFKEVHLCAVHAFYFSV